MHERSSCTHAALTSELLFALHTSRCAAQTLLSLFFFGQPGRRAVPPPAAPCPPPRLYQGHLVLLRRATLQQQHFCCDAFSFSAASCSMVPAALDDVGPPAPAAYDGPSVTAPHSSIPEQLFSAIAPPSHFSIDAHVNVNPLLTLVPQPPTLSSADSWRTGVLFTLRATGIARPAPSPAGLVARSELHCGDFKKIEQKCEYERILCECVLYRPCFAWQSVP